MKREREAESTQKNQGMKNERSVIVSFIAHRDFVFMISGFIVVIGQPTILSYRRERTLNDDSERSLRTAESVTRSERSVSFKDESDTK